MYLFYYNQKIMYLCSVIKNKALTLKKRFMDNELEKEIERLKQKLSDYLRIAKLIKPSNEEYERQIDMMLDDLIILLKKRK